MFYYSVSALHIISEVYLVSRISLVQYMLYSNIDDKLLQIAPFQSPILSQVCVVSSVQTQYEFRVLFSLAVKTQVPLKVSVMSLTQYTAPCLVKSRFLLQTQSMDPPQIHLSV